MSHVRCQRSLQLVATVPGPQNYPWKETIPGRDSVPFPLFGISIDFGSYFFKGFSGIFGSFLMDPISRFFAISPEYARDRARFGHGRHEPGQAGGMTYSTDDEDAILKSLASKIQQPYRPGWAALPGVAKTG